MPQRSASPPQAPAGPSPGAVARCSNLIRLLRTINDVEREDHVHRELKRPTPPRKNLPIRARHVASLQTERTENFKVFCSMTTTTKKWAQTEFTARASAPGADPERRGRHPRPCTTSNSWVEKNKQTQNSKRNVGREDPLGAHRPRHEPRHAPPRDRGIRLGQATTWAICSRGKEKRQSNKRGGNEPQRDEKPDRVFRSTTVGRPSPRIVRREDVSEGEESLGKEHNDVPASPCATPRSVNYGYRGERGPISERSRSLDIDAQPSPDSGRVIHQLKRNRPHGGKGPEDAEPGG